MRVAVISPEQMCGKSCYIATLAGVYSRTQGKSVAIISTGQGEDNVNIVTTEGFNKEVSNAHIFKSIIEAADGKDKSLLYYGAQAGDERVHVFDLTGNTLSRQAQGELIIEAVNKLPASLTLIEICGSLTDPLNKAVLETCHAVLCCIDVSKKHFKMIPEFVQGVPPMLRKNIGYVLTRYNAEVMSDKAIQTMSKINVGNLLRFPYSSVVQKLAINGELDKIAYQIAIGDFTVANFRMPMLEAMQFLFDTDKRKVIRGMDKWSK